MLPGCVRISGNGQHKLRRVGVHEGDSLPEIRISGEVNPDQSPTKHE